MSEPITLNFTHRRDEYIRAMRCHYKSVMRVRLDVTITAIMVGAGCYLIYSRGIGILSLLPIIIAALFCLIVGYAWFVLPRLMYAHEPKLKHPYELVFSDNGILFRTKGIDSKLDWSIYQKWLANDEFYILYGGKRMTSVIPRRAFLNDSVDREFRELLIRKIGVFS